LNQIKAIFSHPINFVYLYLSVHFLIRVLFDNALQIDDAEQIRLGQKLMLGYEIPQPPTYTWLSWIFFKIFGVNIFSLSLLKYTLIGLTFLYIKKISEKLFQNSEIKNLSILSFLLMPSFAWHMHQGFTHTILLSLAIMMSLYYLISVIHTQNYQNYIFLGMSIGIGLISKYSFIIFMIIFIGSLANKDYREGILNKKIFISFFLALIIALPHLIWLIENFDQVFIQINNKLNISSDNGFILKIESLVRLLTNMLAFITPLIFIFLLVLKIDALKNIENFYKPLFLNFYKFFLLVLVLLLFFFSMQSFKVRWLHPIMMIFPFLLLMLTDINHKNMQKLKKIFYFSLTALTLLIVAVRLFQNTVAPDFGYAGRLNTPIFGTLQKLDKSLSNKKFKIKTDDRFLGAHLLIKYPETPIQISGHFYNDFANSNLNCLIFKDNDSDLNVNFNKINNNQLLFWSPIGKKKYQILLEKISWDKCL